jgi:glyoxylase-like metal-dependent hydrolase (beta-lactamase superfamily II)
VSAPFADPAIPLAPRETVHVISRMARIPLEDNYDDVISKAQRGLAIADEQLAHRAQITPADLASLKSGQFHEVAARRVAQHLRLHADALTQLGKKSWQPIQPVFRTGFAAFNATFEDMTVNSFIIWDERTRHAAIFDPGASGENLLELVSSEKLNVRSIFLTHTHDDHIADLAKVVSATDAEVWSSEREPVDFSGAKTFKDGAFFHLGPFAIKTLPTSGHSPGGITYFVTGLSYPLAIAGDSIFAASMGGAPTPTAYSEALTNNRRHILTLYADTVLACGHGPLTTVAQERKHNPFLAY